MAKQRDLRKPKMPMKVSGDDLLGFALHANGRVEAIKQGSGIYGAGYGSFAFSETAWGTNFALSQSTWGWSTAYMVSTWVYRCIEVRKNAVNRMPYGIYSRRSKQPVPKHPLAIALRRAQHQKLFKRIEQSQMLYGETFLELAKNSNDYISDLFWLNNNGMAVIIGAGRILEYAYTALQGGEPNTFGVDQIAFMKTENPMNDLRGMSPTEVMLDEIAIDKDVARVVRAYYANDTRVGIVFIPKVALQPSDQERFMAAFKRDNQGVNQAGKPVVMPTDMTVERIQEPATLDDVQLRESVRREIAAGYGVPLALAGAWDEANYDSVDTQRKSFYEETIIPECDNIADFINADVLPRFDDSGNFIFKFDYAAVLALMEDQVSKTSIVTNKLNAGLITLNEARLATGHAALENGNVFYIPASSIMVKPDLLGEMQPKPSYQPFGNPQVTPYEASQLADGEVPPPPVEVQQQQQIAQGSSVIDPNKPLSANDPPTNVAKKPPVTVERSEQKLLAPPQQTPAEELAAWSEHARKKGFVKAASFVCYVVPKDVQDEVRNALRTLGDKGTGGDRSAIFAKAKLAVNPPTPVLDAWRHYDKLMDTIGNDWLNVYMAQALEAILPIANGTLSDLEVQAALDGAHPDFTQALLGTDEEPGALVKLLTAGMGAAQEAILHGGTANPQKPVRKAMDIDWSLMSVEARDFAKQYVGQLIREIDDTTRKQVQEAVAKWIESGAPLSELKKALTVIFQDASRAQLIAQTESTRSFAEGARERYRRADVTHVKFRTVNDSHVCPTCEKYKGQTMKLDGAVSIPVHPGCRCFWSPVVMEDE